MRRYRRSVAAIPLTILVCVWLVVGRIVPVQADTASAPSLIISQLKITSSNGQFVTLYNPTNFTLDMDRYQLEYFNNYDLAKATSNRLIALTGTLPPHGFYIVNDSELPLCFRAVVNSMSLGFSSTAGLVEVLAQTQSAPGGLVYPALEDYVGWSKTAASGAQTLPGNATAFLLRQPRDEAGNPQVGAAGSGNWLPVQPDSSNACAYVSSTMVPAPVNTGMNQLLPSDEPPASIVETSEDTTDGAAAATLPAADVGLKGPAITEILPNPAGSGNDTTDEFIELYNSNETGFDLTGFTLRTGTTGSHSFTFPTGTVLPPKTFTAFYSAVTRLSLSNSSGQAALLDPFGNSISATGVYGTAAEGQAWALNKGNWAWTTTPTPNAANVIHVPPKKTKKTSAKKTASTSAKKQAAGKYAKLSAAKAGQAAYADPSPGTPIHTWTLALIGGLALLYGAYEYRTDLANRFRQLGGNLGIGRRHRPEAARRRSAGADQ